VHVLYQYVGAVAVRTDIGRNAVVTVVYPEVVQVNVVPAYVKTVGVGGAVISTAVVDVGLHSRMCNLDMVTTN
jgi:hypothetical protein